MFDSMFGKFNTDMNTVLTECVKEYNMNVEMDVLCEEEKLKFANNLINKLGREIQKRINKNYKLVDSTRGDITKLPCYKNLGKALNYLAGTDAAGVRVDLSSEVKIIQDSLKMLASHKEVFMAGYKVGNSALIMTYCSCATAVIECTSIAIASSLGEVTEVKDRTTLGGTIRINYPAKFKALEEINKMAASGKIRKLGDNLVSKKEAVDLVLTAGIAGIAVILLKNVKVLVYSYYHTRIELADRINMIADYVAMKSDRTMDTKLKSKQDKWAKRLTAMAEKIDVDCKTSSAACEKDLRNDHEEISGMSTNWLM